MENFALLIWAHAVWPMRRPDTDSLSVIAGSSWSEEEPDEDLRVLEPWVHQ